MNYKNFLDLWASGDPDSAIVTEAQQHQN